MNNCGNCGKEIGGRTDHFCQEDEPSARPASSEAPRKLSPYERIMRAAKAGRGVRLSADDVTILSIDRAVADAALNHAAGEWVT